MKQHGYRLVNRLMDFIFYLVCGMLLGSMLPAMVVLVLLDDVPTIRRRGRGFVFDSLYEMFSSDTPFADDTGNRVHQIIQSPMLFEIYRGEDDRDHIRHRTKG